MARTPRANIPKTAGQGVSRLSYQKGRSLMGDAPSVGVRFSSGDQRDYGKVKPVKSGEMNVSYGDTAEPGDLHDIANMFRDKPARSPLGPAKGKKLK